MTFAEALSRPPNVVYRSNATPLVARPALSTYAAVREVLAAHASPVNRRFADAYAPSGLTGMAWKAKTVLPQAHETISLALAERRSNEMRRQLTGTFAQELLAAMEAIHHHGKSHGARTESAYELLNRYTPERPITGDVALGAARFPYEHDVNQTHYEWINNQLPKGEKKFQPKVGHDIGGAAMALALFPEYAIYALPQSKQDRKRAYKISRISAFTMVAHAYPDRLKDVLGMNPDVQARSSQDILDNEGLDALVDAFEYKKPYVIDIANLRICDMFAILNVIKERAGFDTKYGLGKAFEDEHASTIAELKTDTTTLLAGLTPSEIEQAKDVTLLLAFADMMDMVVPQDDALARTFTVSVSRVIPLSWSEDSRRIEEDDLNAIQAHLQGEYGPHFWHEAKSHLNPQELMILDDVINGPSKGSKNDARRKMWEAVHLGSTFAGTNWENTRVLPAVLDDYGGMALQHLAHTIPTLMGDGAHQDQEQLEVAVQSYFKGIFINRKQTILAQPNGQALLDNHWEEELNNEQKDTMEAFANKPGGIKLYSTNEINSFKKVLEYVQLAYWIHQGMRSGGIQPNSDDLARLHYARKKVKEFKKRYERGERPIAPTDGYDETGEFHAARTMRRLPTAA